MGLSNKPLENIQDKPANPIVTTILATPLREIEPGIN